MPSNVKVVIQGQNDANAALKEVESQLQGVAKAAQEVASAVGVAFSLRIDHRINGWPVPAPDH